MDNADGSRSSPPARTQVQPPPAACPPANVLGNPNSNAEPHAHDRNAPNAPPDHATSAGSIAPPTPPTAAGTQVSPNDTYTLPTGHFGSGFNGSTMASHTPTHGNNMGRMAWLDMHQYHLVHPPVPALPSDTLSRPPMSSCFQQPPPHLPQQHYNHNASCRPHDWDDQHHPCANNSPWHLALLGGPIVSPRAGNRENKARKLGTSRLNILGLATGKYLINSDGVNTLTAGILVNCGHNRITSDNAITCYNNIIAAHRRILDLWHNPMAHIFGPQVNQILLKSFKLFPPL